MMIDIHLLTRISGDDLAFRQIISSDICDKVDLLITTMNSNVAQGNYHAIYYNICNFHNSSSSYCNLNFINFMGQAKLKMKTAKNEDEKIGICHDIIARLQRGKTDLLHRFPVQPIRVA